jgi:hypothetical protein
VEDTHAEHSAARTTGPIARRSISDVRISPPWAVTIRVRCCPCGPFCRVYAVWVTPVLAPGHPSVKGKDRVMSQQRDHGQRASWSPRATGQKANDNAITAVSTPAPA